MNTKLVFLFLCHVGLLYASDLRLVPSFNSSDEQVVPQVYRFSNNDRVVPRINISPLGVQHDSPIDNERIEKFAVVADSAEKYNDLIDKEIYPAPRTRIEVSDSESNSTNDSKHPIPTPRARIQPSKDTLQSTRITRSSSESNEALNDTKILNNDSKPFAFVYHARPIDLDSDQSIELENGQPEEILVIQDVSSEENRGLNDKTVQGKEISNAEIQRYIDEIDREYSQKKNSTIEVKDKVVDPSLGLRKYIVNDNSAGRFSREAVKAVVPPVSQSSNNKAQTEKVSAVDGEKISTERKTSGGLSYNVSFEEPKAAKPSLSPKSKREANRPLFILDHKKEDVSDESLSQNLTELFKAIKGSSEESKEDFSIKSDSNESSEELTKTDQELPLIPFREQNEKTFDEVLHKMMKEHAKNENLTAENKEDGVYQQEVQHLPHKGPILKNNSNVLAIDPTAASHESESDESLSNKTDKGGEEIGIIILEKTIIVEDENGENRTKNVFIKDSEVNFNLVKSSEERLDGDEEHTPFWHNGFTIGLHVSPLALCMATVLVLMILLMRLALKIHKKRLEAQHLNSLSNPGFSGNNGKKHEFDDVSLQTVCTT